MLIIGLGNLGQEYKNTPHNVGWLALDYIVSQIQSTTNNQIKEDLNFNFNKKFNADILQIYQNQKRIIFAKPNTFMNLSGNAVYQIINFYKINLKDLIILHDEADLLLGDFKESYNRGDAGHNGVKSIIEKLGTKEFTRIRIGIKQSELLTTKIPLEKYVLNAMTQQQLEILNNTFENIYNLILQKILK